MPAIWTQSYPPRPHFTENDVKDQTGKVYVITGGATGLGFHIAATLYQANARVYIAGRSKDKAIQAIAEIKNLAGKSKGTIDFIHLDLSDLATVKPAVQALQLRESRIDVLWNNAGIGADVGNIRSAQDSEIHYATNCIGPLLFTQLLQPQLEAGTDSPSRVIWTGSMTVDFNAPPGGLNMSNLEHSSENGTQLYSCSKVGNWFIASELSRRENAAASRHGATQLPRVIHLVINPGNLKTPIWRYVNWFLVQFLNLVSLYPAKNGSYTALWAGLSDDVRPEDGGRYVIPWGRWHPQPREDILQSLKPQEEGGTGLAARFVEWCEEKSHNYR